MAEQNQIQYPGTSSEGIDEEKNVVNIVTICRDITVSTMISG